MTPLVLLAALHGAAFPSVVPYRMVEADSPPRLDGTLDERVWEKAAVVTDFHQIRPTDHGEPSETTEVRLAYDADHLYVGVRLFDSEPSAITAKGLIQGQTFFSDDRFEVRLDTFNDRRNSYFFQVNPNGMRREALAGNDYWIEEWDTIWFAEARLQDWGWSAEMAIPFKSISFDPASDTWGLNFSRVIPRKGEETPWSSLERRINPNVSGYATGLTGLRQGRGIELVPSLTASHRDNDGDDGFELEPSLTGFYRFTPFLTGALTLNTDFAATEVDDRQINLSRFSLFFPEKRDFFLQDASIFEFGNLETNGRPFFSRRIGLSPSGRPLDLNAGVKLTGRAGNWNVGALAVNQDPGVPGADENLFVGRVTHNVLAESTLGLIATHGDPLSARTNSLLGADFNYRNSRIGGGGQTLLAGAWAQQTDSEGVDGDEGAYGLRVAWPNDRIDGYLELSRIEENFRPALGFVNRTGVDIADSTWRYRHRLTDSRLQWLGTRVQYFRADRIDGGLQSQSVYWNLVDAFSSGNDFFTAFVGEERESLLAPFEIAEGVVIPAGDYAFDRHGFFLETGQQRPVSGTLEVVDGEFFDGTNLTIVPDVTWRPNRHLRLGATYAANDIELPAGEFTSRLYRLRADIAFNGHWAWLNFVQGDNFSDTVSINSRLRWQPRADREYYLVFNQLRDREGGGSLDTEIALKATFNLRM